MNFKATFFIKGKAYISFRGLIKEWRIRKRFFHTWVYLCYSYARVKLQGVCYEVFAMEYFKKHREFGLLSKIFPYCSLYFLHDVADGNACAG